MHEWQKERMRRALRILASETKTYDDPNDDLKSAVSHSAWINIANNVQDFSGIAIGDPERLRQFAQGNPDPTKPTGRHWPGMKPERLRAIAAFLTEDESVLFPLPAMELEDFAPKLQAPFYLMEFLCQETDEVPGVDPRQLEGSYTCTSTHADLRVQYHLTLERPVSDGLLVATMFEDRTDMRADETLDPHPDQVYRHTGWAVISPEDNIYLFLKARRDEQSWNRHFLSIGVDAAVFDGGPLMHFVAINHDYAVELSSFGSPSSPDTSSSEIVDYLNNRVLSFERTV